MYNHCPKAVTVEKAFYIGGFYGANSEAKMMKELRARGPIVADINVPMHFSIYKEGIFSEDRVLDFQPNPSDPDVRVSDNTLRDYDILWEYINHSIVVVGWGRD